MPISPTQPLTLLQIARYWSLELRGTREEESADDLLELLAGALVYGEIHPDQSYYADELKSVMTLIDTVTADIWQSALRGEAGVRAPKGTLKAISRLREIPVRRPDFILWAIGRQYRCPMFWDRARIEEYLSRGWKAGLAVGRHEVRKASGSTEDPPSLSEYSDPFARPSDPLSPGPADSSKSEAWLLEEGRFFHVHFTAGWQKGYVACTQQSPLSQTSPPVAKEPPALISTNKLDAWIAKHGPSLEGNRPKEGWVKFYERCRDDCDGWADKKNGKPAADFSDKTIERRLKAARFKPRKSDK